MLHWSSKFLVWINNFKVVAERVNVFQFSSRIIQNSDHRIMFFVLREKIRQHSKNLRDLKFLDLKVSLKRKYLSIKILLINCLKNLFQWTFDSEIGKLLHLIMIELHHHTQWRHLLIKRAHVERLFKKSFVFWHFTDSEGNNGSCDVCFEVDTDLRCPIARIFFRVGIARFFYWSCSRVFFIRPLHEICIMEMFLARKLSPWKTLSLKICFLLFQEHDQLGKSQR